MSTKRTFEIWGTGKCYFTKKSLAAHINSIQPSLHSAIRSASVHPCIHTSRPTHTQGNQTVNRPTIVGRLFYTIRLVCMSGFVHGCMPGLIVCVFARVLCICTTVFDVSSDLGLHFV